MGKRARVTDSMNRLLELSLVWIALELGYKLGLERGVALGGRTLVPVFLAFCVNIHIAIE